MVYTAIAFSFITLCIIAIIYVQHTTIRVLRNDIDKLNEANEYNFSNVWNSIERTNMEIRERVKNLEQVTYNNLNELEERIRKDFDTEKTQRNTY